VTVDTQEIWKENNGLGSYALAGEKFGAPDSIRIKPISAGSVRFSKAGPPLRSLIANPQSPIKWSRAN
jgi:hypothetical protein